MMPTPLVAACEASTHCVTCADATDLLRLDYISDDPSLGICTDPIGRRSEVMLALVPEARVGTWLVVHAGIALLTSTEPWRAEPSELPPGGNF